MHAPYRPRLARCSTVMLYYPVVKEAGGSSWSFAGLKLLRCDSKNVDVVLDT
jgi:hypothetical protein